jgi:hypothetical protein
MKPVVVVSVDWEANHGKWECKPNGVDYGGVLIGTRILEEVLDEFGVPCTWFVETSTMGDKNLPRVVPDVIRRIALRSRDQIGMHIHWERISTDTRRWYETEDTGWIAEQVAWGVAQLEGLWREERAFRSGSFLHVSQLPAILLAANCRTSSSTLWGRSIRLNAGRDAARRNSRFSKAWQLASKIVGPVPSPYYTDSADIERAGTTGLLEFPIALNVLDSGGRTGRILYNSVIRKARTSTEPMFITLFFHIDELLVPGSGADLQAQPNKVAVQQLRFCLKALCESDGVIFATLATARQIYRQQAGGERN